MRFFLLLLILLSLTVQGQDLARMPLTKNEKAHKVNAHYQWESKDGHFALIDLWLHHNHNYVYRITSNVYNAFSYGRWIQLNGVITLSSTIKQNNLPIEVSFPTKNNDDLEVKKIALVTDLNDSLVTNVFVYVNDDSTACILGDAICKGTFDSIYRIRVQYENNGPSSKWISINSYDGLIQVTIQTKVNLTNFLVFDQKKYQVKTNRLKLIGP